MLASAEAIGKLLRAELVQAALMSTNVDVYGGEAEWLTDKAGRGYPAQAGTGRAIKDHERK